MSKKVIECEYCHTLISEEDVKCPECGANCSAAIKKYRKEQEEKQNAEEKEARQAAQEVFNNFHKTSKTATIIIAVIFLMIPIIGIYQMIQHRNSFNEKKNEITSNHNDVVKEDKEKNTKITIKYQETGELNNFRVTLDSYEFYEYYSKDFERYNTPKGYQKIAFHFVVENIDEEYEKSLYGFVDLSADDTPVESAKMEITTGFDTVKTGKEKYERLDNQTLKSGQTLKGYVGFLVPTDKKVLKFRIDNITIEMDNPAYKG